MFEEIFQINYDLIYFLPFYEYLKELSNKNTELIEKKVEYDSLEYIFKIEDEVIKILLMKDNDKEWITIYKSKIDGAVYEKIEFLHYEEKTKNNSGEYNNIIRYAAHFDDELYSKIVTSSYFYDNNNFVRGESKKRKITLADLEKICKKHTNISELTIRVDEEKFACLEKKDLNHGEVTKLVLGYDV